jgi:hypothetical protein
MGENETHGRDDALLFPSMKTGVDAFETFLDEAVRNASPKGMRAGATKAARYIENVTEDAGLDMNSINNATSTLCTIVRALSYEVEKLRAQMKQEG